MIDLIGQTAIVTGGSQGLGRGIALMLTRVGASVVVAYRDSLDDASNAHKLVAEITAEGQKALAVAMDVTDLDSISAARDQIFNDFSTLDIVVNNAGVLPNSDGAQTTLKDFDDCYNVNVKGVWSVSRAFIPHFKTRRHGKIINIASIAGRKGNLGNAYCASKAAVISLTQSLATELGPDHINVNAVCPGIIWTPMWQALEQRVAQKGCSEKEKVSAFQAGIDSTPLARPQTIEDVANAVIFLASDQAKNITGQSINVDGGLMMN